MENSTFHQERKPNLNTWICPLCKREMNSRGAPAHVRNKHSTSWKKKYLINPKLLKNRDNWFVKTKPYLKVKDIFSDIDYEEDLENINTIDLYYWVGVKIRGGLIYKKKSKLTKIRILLGQILKELKQDLESDAN